MSCLKKSASAARPGTNGASAARPGTNGAPVARPGTKEREERDEELKNLYVDKEELEDKDSNENLAKMVLINDLERVLLLKEGKMQEAEVVAQKNYEKSKKRKRLLEKLNCDAEMCLIFPIEE